MRNIEFERVLSMLHAWLGERVSVLVENPYGPGDELSVVGRLSADLGVEGPFDEELEIDLEDEFGFGVGDSGAFTVKRAAFIGASASEREVQIESGPIDHTLVLVISRMDD